MTETTKSESLQNRMKERIQRIKNRPTANHKPHGRKRLKRRTDEA